MTSPTTSAPTDLGIDVRPVAGNIGAEIHGVDLREDLDDAAVAEIRAALHRWKVVFFRDQHIDHAQQVAFGRRFGQLTPAHPHEDAPPEGFPEILPIDSRRYNKLFGSLDAESAKDAKKKFKVTYDNGWHTDVTALVNPPAGSILRAEIVPPYGGDTQWTNLVAAYEGLPEPLQRLADGLRAKHSFGQPVFDGSEFGKKIKENPLVAIHPVVRVHPETGERALFVSPSFTSRDNEIIGFGPRQSRAILDLFYEQISRPEYTVRFRWNPGDIAFWDNRATAHLGPSDVDITEFDRVLYRVTLEGDVPVGVDGRSSELVAGQPFLAG
ncbi:MULTISPECIES: TauD/TfdA dioxygenase family protein [Pseudofrankia]|uniref:TauD/TfdA dioxygenase family protein n=1 Tax=Pseudofrankia TaxID=2994363 RepID=UPI000234CB4B|nr:MULTISPECIES: TauD/TfdA family dioxygenase [Pseudofrankia]OHV37071.1 taurine dioxygenase [Pseudofrankia sp. EUN1h]